MVSQIWLWLTFLFKQRAKVRLLIQINVCLCVSRNYNTHNLEAVQCTSGPRLSQFIRRNTEENITTREYFLLYS